MIRTLSQRYVGVKTSPSNYELWPLVNMAGIPYGCSRPLLTLLAGALDSTRKASEALGYCS